MTFYDYQHRAGKTAIYPHSMVVTYPALGLAGEVGEVLNKIKKVYRDHAGGISIETKQELKSELGDVLWYLSQLAWDLGIELEDVAANNIAKLERRQREGKLQGSGDKR